MSALDHTRRLLLLVPYLLERPGTTLDTLAEHFVTTRAQIESDLAKLRWCGLPGGFGASFIEVDIEGDGVYVSMADELRRPLRLTDEEALRIVLTLEVFASAFGDDLPSLRSALDKVRGAAGLPDGLSADDDHAPATIDLVRRCRRAIDAGTQVRISYQGRTDAQPRSRVVDPWRLHVEGHWYLQGRDHGADALRSFRLDRVSDLEVLHEPSEQAAPSGELPPPRYRAADHDTVVTLAVPPAAGWVIEALDVDELTEGPDRTRNVTFRTDALDWVARLLLSTGQQIEVSEPADLRTRLATMATRARDLHAAT